MLTLAGLRRWVGRSTAPLPAAGEGEQRPPLLLSVTRDMTACKLAEQAVREANDRLRLIVDNAPIVLCSVDVDGRITHLEGSGLVAAGEKVGPSLEMSVFQRFADIPEGLQCIRRALAGEAGHAIIEARGRVFDCAFAPLRGARGAVVGMSGAAMDITDLRRQETELRSLTEQLAHVSRVALVGEMATGIAHELNQPLTAIGLYFEECVAALEAGPPTDALKEHLQTIASLSNRCGDIIRRVRQFAARKRGLRTWIDLRKAVESAIALCWRQGLHANVRWTVALPDEPLPAYADAVEIQQVLVNLLQNAIEAQSDCPAAERSVKVVAERDPAGRVLITVSDTGPGVAPAAVKRLFEPFYTTKAAGLGLGLRISQTIVESYGGRITYCGGGRGAAFVVAIPTARDTAR